MESLSHGVQIQLDISQPGFYIKIQQGIYHLSISYAFQTAECKEEQIESKKNPPTLLKEKYVRNNVCLCFKESFNQVQRINQIGQIH